VKLRVRDGHGEPVGWKPVTAELTMSPFEATLVLETLVETLRYHLTSTTVATSKDITTPAGDVIRLIVDPRREAHE